MCQNGFLDFRVFGFLGSWVFRLHIPGQHAAKIIGIEKLVKVFINEPYQWTNITQKSAKSKIISAKQESIFHPAKMDKIRATGSR